MMVGGLNTNLRGGKPTDTGTMGMPKKGVSPTPAKNPLCNPGNVYFNFINLGATGLVGELLEVLGENTHLTTEPAGLCQGCLEGNGVLGVTEPGTQVRTRCWHCTLAQRSTVMNYAEAQHGLRS